MKGIENLYHTHSSFRKPHDVNACHGINTARWSRKCLSFLHTESLLGRKYEINIIISVDCNSVLIFYLAAHVR